MADEAKKLDDGSFEAEVVGTPTPFQRELERLIADRVEPANEPSNPPPARSAVRNMLTSGTETSGSEVDSALREEAESTFAHMKTLEGAKLVEFRQRIRTERPELFAAMIVLIEERNAASHARSEVLRARIRNRMAQHEAVHGLMDQALRNTTEAGRVRLEEIKKAFGE